MADPTAGMSPGGMIDAIASLVDDGVATITGKVDQVRTWSNEDPCSRQAFLAEHALTVDPMVRRLQGSIAWLQSKGNRALEQAIAAHGRPSAQYAGGRRLAAMVADQALPTPPAAILHALLGGPIGAGAARSAWLDWIDQRLPPGRPSTRRSGQRLIGSDVWLDGGRLQGPTLRGVYDQWMQIERAGVGPPGRLQWRDRVAGGIAKLSELRAKQAILHAEIARYETRCVELRATQEGRTDLAIADALAASEAARQAARVRSWLPWGALALGLVLVLRR